MRLGLRSPAKINLTLEVLYQRSDGFHQLKTVLQELKGLIRNKDYMLSIAPVETLGKAVVF